MTDQHRPRHDSLPGLLDVQLSFPEPFVSVPRSLESIIKRDDRVEQFDTLKIADAIFQAADSIGGDDQNLSRSLASSVTLYLSNQSRTEPLHVSHVDTAVERVLVEMGHERTALAYIQHRNRHLQLKELHDGDARSVRNALAEWRWNRHAADSDQTPEERIAEQLENFSIPENRQAELQNTILESLQALSLSNPPLELIKQMTRAVLTEHSLLDASMSLAQLNIDLTTVEQAFVGPFHNPDLLSTPDSSDRVLAARTKESYALNTLFSSDIANAHTRGDLHLHDLGSVDRLHSISLHPDCIKRFGPLSNFAREEVPPARKINTLIEDIASSTRILTRYCTDSIQWEAVNYSLAPYLIEFDEQALLDVSEMLILSLMDQHEGTKLCTTKLGIAWDIPHYLQGIEAIGPNGTPTGKQYEYYQQTARDFGQCLLQVFRRIAESYETFNLPLPVVTLPASSTTDTAATAFTNKVALCALVLDDIVVQCDHDIPLLPFHEETLQPRSMFAQFATLNLARLGYIAADGADFWKELEYLFETAALAFIEKQTFLRSLAQRKTIGSYSHFALLQDGKPFADLATAEFGLVLCGFHECLTSLCELPKFTNIEYDEFAEQILSQLTTQCDDLFSTRGIRVSLQTGESQDIAERLTRIDLAHFHDAVSTDGDDSENYAYATTTAKFEAVMSYEAFEQHLLSTLTYQDWIHGAVTLQCPDTDATFPEQLAQTLTHFFQKQPAIALYLHR